MKFIFSYQLFESSSNTSLLGTAEKLLYPLPWWNSIKKQIDPKIQLVLDTKSRRLAEAHFDVFASSPEKVVIQIKKEENSPQWKGTLAHELTHAIQWLTGNLGDLMFITDVTREIDNFSSAEIWKKTLFAIYVSCPQETQAWEAESVYFKEPILKTMLPWMKKFDPKEIAKELSELTPRKNRWEMKSFEELPQCWQESYENYDDAISGSPILKMGKLNLEEFLNHYDSSFKKACQKLG